MNYTYLVLDLLVLAGPLIMSFEKQVRFYKSWSSFLVAFIAVGIPFILWDELFTRLGVWGFEETYLSGLSIGHLPIEEVLFFLVVPYAFIFIFRSLYIYLKVKELSTKKNKVLSFALAGVFLLVAVLYSAQSYTFYTFILLAMVFFLHAFFGAPMSLKKFFIAYTLTLIPFFLVNGVLTRGVEAGLPIVWYGEGHYWGFRLYTIPLEDAFYGLLLCFSFLWIFEIHTNFLSKNR